MENKWVATVIALSAPALFLSGCGSGGGGQSHECANKELDLKTQSFTGKISSTLEVGGTKHTLDDSEVTMMLDREKVNIRFDSTESGTIKINGEDITGSVHSKSFFSVAKKVFAAGADVTADGKKYSNCTVVDFSKMEGFPTAEAAKALLDVLINKLLSGSSCSSNDGTYDTFALDKKIPDDLPVPLPKNFSDLTGETKDQLQCDKDYMLHSVSGSIQATTTKPHDISHNGTTITIPAGKIHVDMTLTVDGGVAKPQGPGDSDLDYSSWGECVTFQPTHMPHPPSALFDFHGPTTNQFSGLVMTAVDELLQKLSQPSSTMVV